MTIQSYLDLTDTLAPGAVDAALRLRWLSELEGRVQVELHDRPPEELTLITESTPRETVLTVPHPYDRLYWMYCLAMTDSLAGDSARYENAAALFNEAYAGYGRWLKRHAA